MVEISDINDQASLREWLEALPFDEDENRRVAVTIAHRAAMRVLPVFWDGANSSVNARKNDLTALPVLRVSLISRAASAAWNESKPIVGRFQRLKSILIRHRFGGQKTH